ncbi:MAG TPA: hypothetical protein VGC41_03665 [Kofleriaceae bacterium]
MRLALVLLVSACATYDEHHIESAWTIDRLGDGADLGCPAGWTTVRLVAVDPQTPGTRVVDTFPCDAGEGTSSLLPADSYLAWLEVWDGAKVLATTPPTTTDVTSFNPQLLAAIYVDAGYVTASWPSTSQPVSIAFANGTITSTTTFDLDARGGVIGPLHAGHYEVTARVGSWSETLPVIEIAAPNGLTDLGVLPISDRQ